MRHRRMHSRQFLNWHFSTLDIQNLHLFKAIIMQTNTTETLFNLAIADSVSKQEKFTFSNMYNPIYLLNSHVLTIITLKSNTQNFKREPQDEDYKVQALWKSFNIVLFQQHSSVPATHQLNAARRSGLRTVLSPITYQTLNQHYHTTWEMGGLISFIFLLCCL